MFMKKVNRSDYKVSPPTYRMANIPSMFDNIKVVVGSDESIFNETYVTGVLENNRTVKFKKSALVFA